MKINAMDGIVSAGRAAQASESAGAQAAEQARASKTESAPEASAHGGLHLSERVGEADKVVAAAKEHSELRMDVVEQARADLAAGTLTADPHELAALVARDLF